MNKTDILNTLGKYHLDINEFMIISGASMVIQEIKENTKDIDIAVSKEYYDYLEKNYKCDVAKVINGLNIYSIDDVINFSTNYYNKDEAIMYEGYPIQKLDKIREMKLKLSRQKDIQDINLINKYLELPPLVLAYIGDSVYETYIRKYLIDKGFINVNNLQKEAIKYVSAKSQTKLLEKLVNENYLTFDELEIVRKGRNCKSHKAPKNTDITTYKYSTGFEALIGYLYLEKDNERIKQIIKEIIGE